MRILFDHQIISLQNYGGISEYFSKIIDGINETEGCTAELTNPNLGNEVILKKLDKINSWERIVWKSLPHKGYRVRNIYTSVKLKVSTYDIFHPTYYNPYFLKWIPTTKPWTFTYHDMTHERMGSLFPGLKNELFQQEKKYLVNKASKFIAISHTTKNDILEYYKINSDRVQVIHHGNPFEDVDIGAIPPIESLHEPFLLFVGTRYNYKNFNHYLIAVAPLLKKYSIKLICAGGGLFSLEEKQIIAKLGIATLVTQVSINKKRLIQLYKSAIAFTYPSLYEGFGLPILEAFACGCPCILSDIEVFQEVAGKDAALYFSPYDVDSIRQSIERILNNSDLGGNLIDQGKERLKYFSWANTLNKTLSLYMELIA
ncbi:glycosyltransferase family 4 protein [Tellurirhabdus rosea]|uniref:glycosyltransferase family 4 protein n=1 Tax=Tellurirhabdus rosea TaxID=2674997 RepID=UPI00224FB778|nr:glycosyltransferase family 1 protein [Tellurirhabdus rosea]